MLNNDFFKEVESFVFKLFKDSLPMQAVYHNFTHTAYVVKSAHEIALAEAISESDLELLLLAAWFHDTGFISETKNHEEKSKEIAKAFLIKKGFSEEKIAKVLAYIDATRVPQKPTNKIEEIICDADLFHLGSEDFEKTSQLLRAEWEYLCDKHLTDVAWYQENDKFLSEHNYFTTYAYQKRHHQKILNWIKVQKNLQKAIVKEKEQQTKSKLKKSKQKREKLKENRSDRGIETMYRVTLKNHIKLSDIADTKANILLSVSAITLSIALSMLFPKLDKPDNYYLIYPTLMFLFITVATIIFSILATRPKITSGNFTKEDVKNKKVNLLFFGNFHQLPLEDFQEGMLEMMNDRDYLYKSLMKDLYFLGIVLNRKYKLLRVAYGIFMIGIIISVIAFVIAFELMKSVGVEVL